MMSEVHIGKTASRRFIPTAVVVVPCRMELCGDTSPRRVDAAGTTSFVVLVLEASETDNGTCTNNAAGLWSMQKNGFVKKTMSDERRRVQIYGNVPDIPGLRRKNKPAQI